MPSIISCKTGRKIVMKSGSPEGSKNSTFLSRSKMTGRMLFFKGVGDFDTMVYYLLPDAHYSNANRVCYWGGPDETGMLALIKGRKNYIHLWCYDIGYEGKGRICEVEPGDFNVKEVTWNTRPSAGDFITDFSIIEGLENTWVKLPMGGTGAIMIKSSPDNVSPYPGICFYSSQNSDKTKRPYFTDT